MNHALAIVALSLAGCASPSVPYTVEHPTRAFAITVGHGMYNAWFSDGGPTVLTVRNPTPTRVQLHIACDATAPAPIDRGHIEWWLCLGPGKETRRFIELMNVDAISDVCRVAEYWTVTGDCIESNDG